MSDADTGADGWLVACLCAAWCRSCDTYRETFTAVARDPAQAAARFVWIDIEDESDALAPFDLDVENFPTLLIARGGELRFLGTVLPHASTLVRTIEAARSAVQPGMVVQDTAGLAACARRVGTDVR